MIRPDAESGPVHIANAHSVIHYPPGSQPELRDLGATGTPMSTTQQPQILGGGFAGKMEITICRVVVIVALWLGH